MYPVSNAVRALYENEYQKVLRITGTDANGHSIAITDGNVVENGFAIDRFSVNGEKLEVGTATASELTLNVDNRDGAYSDIRFEGAELFVEIGIAAWDASNPQVTYMPCGYFTVEEQTRRSSVIQLKALDRMIRFDKIVNINTLVDYDWVDASANNIVNESGDNFVFATEAFAFPCTVAELVQSCCDICDVELAEDISGNINASYTIEALPELYQSITLRMLIQWCAGFMGVNAYIDWDGKMRFAWYGYNSGYTSTKANRFFSQIEENNITITGVSFSDPSGITYISGSSDYALDLTGNYLIPGGDAQTIVSAISAARAGFSYRPCSLTVVGIPYLWPMDCFSVRDNNDVSRTSCVTGVNFTLNGNTLIQSVGRSETANSYTEPYDFTTQQLHTIEKIQSDAATETADAVASATNQITGALGGNVRFIYDANQKLTEIVIIDTDDIATATKVWRWNSGGLGYSSTGYNGTYALAMTQDGAIVADFITTGTLDGEKIKAKLFEITDASAAIIARFNDKIVLGKSDMGHVEITFNSMNVLDKEDTTYISIGDSRSEDGYTHFINEYAGTGSQRDFLAVPSVAYSTITQVTIDSVTVNGAVVDPSLYSKTAIGTNGVYVRFATAPTNGATIVIDAITDLSYFHLDFGTRIDGMFVGNYSANLGTDNASDAPYTLMQGENIVARGSYSQVMGRGCQGHWFGEHIFGEYNAYSAPGASTARRRYNWRPVEIVGNGTSENNRSNARTLTWMGDQWLRGALTQTADSTIETDTGDSVPDVSGIRARVYYRDDDDEENEHIGYYAQDVASVAPYLVSTDTNGNKALDYIGFLCAKIETLESRLTALEGRL